MTPEQWEAMGQLSRELGSDTVLPIPGYGDLETLGWGADNAMMREAVAASPLPPMPLAVLAHGKPIIVLDDTRVIHHRRVGSAPAGELRKPGHPRASGAVHGGQRERPRHPPGSAGAGDRSGSAGGRGRAQPGHLVRPDLLLRGRGGVASPVTTGGHGDTRGAPPASVPQTAAGTRRGAGVPPSPGGGQRGTPGRHAGLLASATGDGIRGSRMVGEACSPRSAISC